MERFTLPRDIYFGENALDSLQLLEGKRAMVVVGGHSMQKFGFLDRTIKNLEQAGMEVKTFEGVEPDPSLETVDKGAKAMMEFEPDWIVAIGGGSPIDAAKAMWVFYEYPGSKFEDLITPFSFPKLRKKAKFCAISSTSGTATEVTAFAVITDYATGIKYPLADFNITPDIAIVDPELARKMPKSLTANTGMDAFTHAIEAYVSTVAQPFTDALAVKAIQIVDEHLIASYNGKMKSRDQMHYGQCCAGMAFSNALLGIVHSMAHKTGAAFDTGHIPHGLANAMYLPYVIKFNSKNDRAKIRYCEIADVIGITGTPDQKINELCNKIINMDKEMGIPTTLKQFGIKKDEFDEKVKTIASNALEDACTGSNPRKISVNQMTKLLNCIYDGKEVDF